MPIHFKVFNAIQSGELAEVWASNELLAIYVRVGCMAIASFADRNGDRFTVAKSRLGDLTGTRSPATAMLRLRCLAATGALVVECSETTVDLTIPKLAESQFNRKPNRPTRSAPSSPTSTSSSEDISVASRPQSTRSTSPDSGPAFTLDGGPAKKAKPDLPLEEIAAAFVAYGKTVRSWSKARLAALSARLTEAEFDPDCLAAAVHGYVWLHRHPTGDFDPMAHLTPETIFRPANFAKYLDAAYEAREAGQIPPFRIGPKRPPSGQDVLDEILGVTDDDVPPRDPWEIH